MKKKILLAATLILLVVIFSVAFVITFKEFHKTPEGAIRFYIVLHKGPWALSNVKIIRGKYIDKFYGQQYVVEGFTDRVTGMELRFFYLKKDESGLWKITSVGTGP
ncbi:hypothetical protein ELD05_01830 [Caldicellulosiruptor changbaiensis]|uniref:Uncharacterized protein n=1 Tax=Caldicellulosiruptor changbaiensis TaxID=1222016 RepID=A0A3T0D2T1_9FIRM|nr:hypothetical protein [Caldicellulosiruptor changbaiensis]AZT89515.1 hypothetical protein ELD05_01830 [Caldicellulosiruptor changbaiensis]